MKRNHVLFAIVIIFFCLIVSLWYLDLLIFLKDYGAAVGPSIAVVLFYVKFYLDESKDREKSEQDLSKLKEFIKKSQPPRAMANYTITEGGISIDSDLSNSSNITTFYQRVLILKKYVDDIYEKNHHVMKSDEVIQFAFIKWWTDFLIKEIDKRRLELSEIRVLIDKSKDSDDINVIDHANKAFRDYQLEEQLFIKIIDIGYHNLKDACESDHDFELSYKYPDIEDVDKK